MVKKGFRVDSCSCFGGYAGLLSGGCSANHSDRYLLYFESSVLNPSALNPSTLNPKRDRVLVERFWS